MHLHVILVDSTDNMYNELSGKSPDRSMSGFSTAGSKFISIVRRARMVSAGDNGI
jgi:hypothetical protein